jgi:hypothetical protein
VNQNPFRDNKDSLYGEIQRLRSELEELRARDPRLSGPAYIATQSEADRLEAFTFLVKLANKVLQDKAVVEIFSAHVNPADFWAGEIARTTTLKILEIEGDVPAIRIVERTKVPPEPAYRLD